MTAFARQQRRKYYNALAYVKRKQARDTKNLSARIWNITEWDENRAEVKEMSSCK